MCRLINHDDAPNTRLVCVVHDSAIHLVALYVEHCRLKASANLPTNSILLYSPHQRQITSSQVGLSFCGALCSIFGLLLLTQVALTCADVGTGEQLTADYGEPYWRAHGRRKIVL